MFQQIASREICRVKMWREFEKKLRSCAKTLHRSQPQCAERGGQRMPTNVIKLHISFGVMRTSRFCVSKLVNDSINLIWCAHTLELKSDTGPSLACAGCAHCTRAQQPRSADGEFQMAHQTTQRKLHFFPAIINGLGVLFYAAISDERNAKAFHISPFVQGISDHHARAHAHPMDTCMLACTPI